MEKLFKLQLNRTESADILEIGFIPGINATNAEYVKYVDKALTELIEQAGMRGSLIKITGQCSNILSAHIGHKVCHLYASVAIFDPKMSMSDNPEKIGRGAYIITMSHGGMPIGTVIE